MRWYDVEISGRYEGKPREVNETVQARNEELAVKKAVAAEFDRPDWSEIVWDFSDGGRMVITVQDDEDGFKTFKTRHSSLYDLVTEVTDGARLARLTGAPTLPLDLGEEETRRAATAVAYTPDAYQRQVMATWGGGDNLMAALLGVVGEAGELADLHKKHFFKPGSRATREQVLDETADVTYYIAVLAHLWGFTFDDMFAHLAVKLAGGHGWVSPSNSTGLEANDAR